MSLLEETSGRDCFSSRIEELVLIPEASTVQSSIFTVDISCSFAAQVDKSDEEIRVIDIVVAYPGIVSQVMACILKGIVTTEKKNHPGLDDWG